MPRQITGSSPVRTRWGRRPSVNVFAGWYKSRNGIDAGSGVVLAIAAQAASAKFLLFSCAPFSHVRVHADRRLERLPVDVPRWDRSKNGLVWLVGSNHRDPPYPVIRHDPENQS
jgi:hypothetical protein